MWFHPETAARLAALLEIPAGGRRGGDGQRRPADLGEQQLRHGGHRPRARRRGARRRLGHPLGARRGLQPDRRLSRWPTPRREEVLAYRFPDERLRGAAGADGAASPPARATTSSAATSRPASSRCTGGCAGMEDAMLDMADDPELAARDVRPLRRLRRSLLAEAACDRFPLDWLWTGDDVAGQQCADDEPARLARADQAAPGARLRRRARRTACRWPTTAAARCGRSSPT